MNTFPRLSAFLFGFRADRRGATAVEFALVVLPFLTILAAIIETAFTIWATQNLDFALQRAVRPILTGAFQTANAGQTDPATILGNLKSAMCGSGSGTAVTLFDCQNIKLDVYVSASFAAGATPTAFNPQTQNWASNAGTQYTCPQAGSIVVVSAAVKFPVFFSFLKLNSQTFADGSRLMQSIAVFRTEPFQVASSTSCGS